MTHEEALRGQMKAWVENWRRVAPFLEAERAARLRALDEAEAGRIAEEVVWPGVTGTGADGSGGDRGKGLEPMIDALRRLGWVA